MLCQNKTQMKKLILPLLLVMLVYTAMAQVKITGSVRDNKNKPIIGASITLKDTYDGAVTDSTGKFAFKTAEKGDFTIEVKSINYKTIQQKLNIGSQPIILNFFIKEEINELTAVTVTAGSF